MTCVTFRLHYQSGDPKLSLPRPENEHHDDILFVRCHTLGACRVGVQASAAMASLKPNPHALSWPVLKEIPVTPKPFKSATPEVSFNGTFCRAVRLGEASSERAADRRKTRARSGTVPFIVTAELNSARSSSDGEQGSTHCSSNPSELRIVAWALSKYRALSYQNIFSKPCSKWIEIGSRCWS